MRADYLYLIPHHYDSDTYKAFDDMEAYLLEAGVSEELIAMAITSKGLFTHYKDIPSFFWENSLLDPSTFYYHHALQLQPAPPSFNRRSCTFTNPKDYIEMKIVFTEQDVLNYFYSKILIPENRARDLGGLQYLIKKEKPVVFQDITITFLDFLLLTIDIASLSTFNPFITLLDIYQNHAAKTYEMLHVLLKNKQKNFKLRTGESIECFI